MNPATKPHPDARWVSDYNQWSYDIRWWCGWCGNEVSALIWYCMQDDCVALGVTSGLYKASFLAEDIRDLKRGREDED